MKRALWCWKRSGTVKKKLAQRKSKDGHPAHTRAGNTRRHELALG